MRDLLVVVAIVCSPSAFCLGVGFWLGRWFELARRDDTATPTGVHLVLDSARPDRAVPAAIIIPITGARTHPAGSGPGGAA